MLTSCNNPRTPKPRIFVTGMGMLTPAGRGTSALWELAKRKGTYLSEGFGILNLTAERIALQCALEAMEQAKWARLTADDGFVLATTTGQTPAWESDLMALLKKPELGSTFFPKFSELPIGGFMRKLCQSLAFSGRSQLITTACAAGVHAIALGSSWLRSGRTKRCLVGGTEVLCRLIQSGFGSLQLLSKTPCKPFDGNRTGINLSEGGAFLCLETEPGPSPLAEIRGHGSSLDAFHMTSPHPEGLGSVRALEKAIQSSGLALDAIDWIHAHGTGSLHNDLSESLAIQKLFATIETPPVTSTKGTHGHFLGATGVIEVALIVESLLRQEMLPTTGFENADEKISIPVLSVARKAVLKNVLKNVSGFGGTNAAIVVGRA